MVLTFDDAVKSHRTFVGPLLRELGFQATFFVTHAWMNDAANFMSWKDIAELHDMGFEIGNHTWTHSDFSQPRNAARLHGELALVENELAKVKVPRPISFAWPGNGFGPEALGVLRERRYQFARRGGMPEVEYGRATPGPLYDPALRHPLLIPTTGDSYPNWTFEHFQAVMARQGPGQIAVLQFHGVPDTVHPWVHTEPALFRRYMEWLKVEGYRTLAVRDLAQFVPSGGPSQDPVLSMRNPLRPPDKLRAPVEVEQTRSRLGYWGGVMHRHRYDRAEMRAVTGGTAFENAVVDVPRDSILPYPGGRHPRIGFLDGAIGPQRGTKASVFLPWDPQSYVVVDVPEAIFSGRTLLFLAHTHLPTIWDEQNKVIENVEWTPREGGGLESRWVLPNKIAFGASVAPAAGGADLELWIENGTPEPLVQLRAQVCVMLARARGFAAQTNDNKRFDKPRAVIAAAGHEISVEWEPCQRVWGNANCPCMHSDPGFDDCAPGATVRARGKLRMA